MKTIFVALLFGMSAQAATVNVPYRGFECQLANAAGFAQVLSDGRNGVLRAAAGQSTLTEQSLSIANGVLHLHATATHSPTGVKASFSIFMIAPKGLPLKNIPGTVFGYPSMPVLSAPGPFGSSAGGWLDPLSGMVPSELPVGMVPWAFSSCTIAL